MPRTKRARLFVSRAQTEGAPAIEAPTRAGAWAFALPCVALTLSVLAQHAQSEMSTRAAKTILIQLRLCAYFIMPPFLELGSIRSSLINVAIFESRHGKQHTSNRKN